MALSLGFTTRRGLHHDCPLSPLLSGFVNETGTRTPYPHVRLVVLVFAQGINFLTQFMGDGRTSE